MIHGVLDLTHDRGIRLAYVRVCALCRDHAAIPTILGEWESELGRCLYGLCDPCATMYELSSGRTKAKVKRRISGFLRRHIDDATHDPVTWGPCAQCGRLAVVSGSLWTDILEGGRVTLLCRCGGSKVFLYDRVAKAVVATDLRGSIH